MNPKNQHENEPQQNNNEEAGTTSAILWEEVEEHSEESRDSADEPTRAEMGHDVMPDINAGEDG